MYELLQEHQLCDYYAISEVSGSKPLIDSPGAFDIVEIPEVRRQIVEFEQGHHIRLVFTIPNVHCPSCVWLLEKLERFDAGILKSTVDLLRKTVRVDVDSRKTSPRNVAQLLASIGYAPLLRAEGTLPNSNARHRSLYLRLGVAGFATGNVMLFAIARYLAGESGFPSTLESVFNTASIVLSIPVLLFSASPWFSASWKALRRLSLNLDVPVALGIAVLFSRSVFDILVGSTEGYLDSFNGLVFFLLIGRLFQQKAFDAVSFDRTWRSFFPLSVTVEVQGLATSVRVDEVRIGDALHVRNNEVIPCDSVMVSPVGYVDYSFVTGESVPVECTAGEILYAGGKVLGKGIVCTASRDVSHGYLASLWDRNSVARERSTLMDVSARFGKIFVVLAVGLAIIGGIAWLPDVEMAMQVFTAVLIIACPCALTLAAPITLGTVMGRLSRAGIYLKNIGTLLELARIREVVFDKTGTLMTATARVQLIPQVTDAMLDCIVSAAAQSTHPVCRAIVDELGGHTRMSVDACSEVAGKGLHCLVGNYEVLIGSVQWLEHNGVNLGSPGSQLKQVTSYIAINDEVVGTVQLLSQLRNNVGEMIAAIRSKYRATVMSGDGPRDRDVLAQEFSEQDLLFSLGPDQKAQNVVDRQNQGRPVLMIGDGLNDGPAMSVADAAIAVTDQTATLVPACDVIMRASSLPAVPYLLSLAKAMHTWIWVIFGVSMLYNVIGLTLALLGILSPLYVAILMPVSSLTVIALSVVGARVSVRSRKWE